MRTSTGETDSPYDLIIDNLSMSFEREGQTVPVLNKLELYVKKGEFLSIVGASGCGKSTLLRLIAGLTGGYSGSIRIGGSEVRSKKVGFVFQEHRLFPWFTVFENIAFGLGSNFRGDKDAIVKEHLALVRLSGFANSYPQQLSGGMRQRVAIARALVSSPEILLLDEPFGALDALTRINMQKEILSIWQRSGTTAIIVTHDIDEAIYLGDRVAIMADSPGYFKKVVTVPLPQPKDRNSFDFVRIKKEIYLEFFNEEEIPYDFSI